MSRPTLAMKWLEKNSDKLGRKYKSQWVLIGAKGVKEHSRSYAKVVCEAKENQLIIKIPENPSSAYFY